MRLPMSSGAGPLISLATTVIRCCILLNKRNWRNSSSIWMENTIIGLVEEKQRFIASYPLSKGYLISPISRENHVLLSCSHCYDRRITFTDLFGDGVLTIGLRCSARTMLSFISATGNQQQHVGNICSLWAIYWEDSPILGPLVDLINRRWPKRFSDQTRLMLPSSR